MNGNLKSPDLKHLQNAEAVNADSADQDLFQAVHL